MGCGTPFRDALFFRIAGVAILALSFACSVLGILLSQKIELKGGFRQGCGAARPHVRVVP